MPHNQDPTKIWNNIAKLYQDKFMELDLYNDTYDQFCQLLEKQNPSILEIGCGPGNITKYLLGQRKDFKITAIDIASNMVQLAQQNNPNANCKVMDSRAIDQIKETFDAIVCGFCIPYLSPEECSKLITDCKNLLRPKGILYLSFVEGHPSQSAFQTGSSGDQLFFNFHELGHLKKAFDQNNFKIKNTYKIEYPKSAEIIEIHTVLILEVE